MNLAPLTYQAIYALELIHLISTLIWLTVVIYFLDIDECAENSDNCHNATVCTNTIGSFKCHCPAGLSGDGITCIGKRTYFA